MVVDAVVIGLSVAGLGYVAHGWIASTDRFRRRDTDTSDPANTDAAPDAPAPVMTAPAELPPGAADPEPPATPSEDTSPGDPAPREAPAETAPAPETPEPAAPAAAATDAPAPPTEGPGGAVLPGAVTSAPLDLGLHVDLDDTDYPEAEIVELHDADDVLTLEFDEDKGAHLHVVYGEAEAEVEAGRAQSAWLDVYLSRSDWLGPHDLDSSGEYRPSLARHVIRVDLGSCVTAPDGTRTGHINEDPEIFFDREVATENQYRV